MPTYSYVCTECGDRFDKVQAFTEDALTTCEKCSGRLRKLFNSVGVVFKGSGFYRTDSREAGKKDKSSSNGSSSNSGSGESNSGSTSSESKSSGSSEKASSSTASTAAASS
ncbi:FmdB family transcriptional regulator [Mycobacterium gordonae]|uniref:FmdB family transcriptional regulator n=1 Tax=Mycobacterium gordonae TaxID=1778 RepID=A0A0Q2QK32_MYCGO|nr:MULTISPECIES: FmdB family zinc ribbon protein [Mycobacterium]KQH80245.1 FmdB family transcriptional regulator [Mycobacterium gordonae]MDP7732459.1 zinc ribbon domain-containing protein [Mycobacterium sp. TY813]